MPLFSPHTHKRNASPEIIPQSKKARLEGRNLLAQNQTFNTALSSTSDAVMFPTSTGSKPQGRTPLAVLDAQEGLGRDATNPIIVDSDEDHGLLSLRPKGSEKGLAQTQLPPRYRRAKSVRRECCTRIPSHDTDGSSPVATSCHFHTDIKVEGDIVTLNKIPVNIDYDAINSFLKQHGFHSSVKIKVLKHYGESQAVLQFSHDDIAIAAADLVKQLTPIPNVDDFPPSFRSPEHIGKLSGELNRAPETQDPYGSLRRDIYDAEESSSDESSSDTPVSSFVCSNPTVTTRATHHEDINHEGEKVNTLYNYQPNPVTSASSSVSKFKYQNQGFKLIPSGRPSTVLTGSAFKPKLSQVPRAPHGRPRRVLVPSTNAFPLITVSMRADLQFFDPRKRYRISSYSMPSYQYQHVVDACIFENVAVIGYDDGPYQLSTVRLFEDKAPLHTELQHQGHQKHPHTLQYKGASTISCMTIKSPTPGQYLEVISGGYDKSIRLWKIFTDNVAESIKATTLTTIPSTLSSRGRTLYVGSGRRLLTLDLAHLMAKPTSAALSNQIHYIHSHPEAPSVSILEVDNLDLQIQIFDNRKHRSFDRTPDCQFGYRSPNAKYSRGSTYLSLFSKGYPDGCLCLWDYRNPKCPIMETKTQLQGPIVHSTFSGPEIICFGNGGLTFLDYVGNIL